VIAERNRRDFAPAFFADLRAKTAAAGGPQNMIDNISKGRIAPVELVAHKP
jgi:hypothetical protein